MSVEDEVGTVGITDYAQKELGDIVFVDLPEVGRTVAAGEEFATVESVKAVAEVFAPAVGEVCLLRPPEGPGLRFDSGVMEGQRIGAAFDPMLAKLIAHGKTREEALDRARAALRDGVLLGVATNAAYLERLLGHPGFVAGELSTHFLDEHADDLALPPLS